MVDDLEEYPEHNKLVAISKYSQVVGDFLTWLGDERSFFIARYQVDGVWDEDIVHIDQTIQQLLADFFEIDLDKIEEEKRAMLAVIHDLNQGGEK